MKTIMLGNETIQTITYCEKLLRAVPVNEHSEQWTLWTTLDQIDKHIGPDHKVKCATCYNEELIRA